MERDINAGSIHHSPFPTMGPGAAGWTPVQQQCTKVHPQSQPAFNPKTN
jgi:hypothetical protein